MDALDQNKKDHLLDKLLFLGAMIFMLSLVGYLYCVTFIPLDPHQSNIASIVIGTIGPVISLVVGFYWGSSRSSKDKDKAIQQLANNAATSAAEEPMQPE
jgi:uncharacterized membrane protein